MLDTDDIRYSFWLEKELEKNVKRLAGFQSTLPARGATGQATGRGGITPFQSTLPARGATEWRG